jgi:hypothetical protein
MSVQGSQSIMTDQESGIPYTVAEIAGSFSIPWPGTYRVKLKANYSVWDAETSTKTINVTGEKLIPDGRYELMQFGYTSNGNDTTYTRASGFTAANNYIQILDGWSLNYGFDLSFSAAERAQYPWLTQDKLDASNTNCQYSCALQTGQTNRYDFTITYQAKEVRLTFEKLPNSIIKFSWKRGTTGPTYTLQYKLK